MKNPFPGMNPWLEEYWRDVHAKLLVYAADNLNGELPGDLSASIDERLLFLCSLSFLMLWKQLLQGACSILHLVGAPRWQT